LEKQQQEAMTDTAAADINNIFLRKTFTKLTLAFIRPFLLYARAPQPEGYANPYLVDMSLPRFSNGEFLEAVKTRTTLEALSAFPLEGTTVLAKRAKLADLYERFMRSINFEPWFDRLRRVAQGDADRAQMVAICRFAGAGGLTDLLGSMRAAECEQTLDKAVAHYRKQQYVATIDPATLSTLRGSVEAIRARCSALEIHSSTISWEQMASTSEAEMPETDSPDVPGYARPSASLTLNIRDDHF
jgi:hypothetical protein